MKRTLFAALAALTLLAGCSSSEGVTTPEPLPTPTPVPLEELCEVRAVSLGLTADGRAARVWGLGQIATWKANAKFAGETMLLPEGQVFDPDTCPESVGWRWSKVGQAADGCGEQGQADWHTWTLACDVPGKIRVCAAPYGYLNIVGCFDSEVVGL